MKQIFAFILFAICSFSSSASHISAGEMYYDYLGNNDYEVHILVYRDCGGVSLDEVVSFTVFDQANNVLQEVSIALDTSNIQQFDYTNIYSSPCISQFSGSCLEYYTYSTVINLPPIIGGYVLSYQRCCLSSQIINITDSDYYGYTFYCRIPGLETGQFENSSPRFQGHPLFVACLNDIDSFIHSATDPDGDSLVYSLLTPYGVNMGVTGNADPSPEAPPPYFPLNYETSFTAQAPLGPGSISIYNSVTAEMVVKPVFVGMFAMGIKVDEYKSDTLMNTIFRNLNLQVTLSDLGIQEDQLSQEISIYPNPAINDIEIKCKLDHGLTILTADGKVVLRRNGTKEKSYIVNLSSFESGLYYFQFESALGKVLRKVVK